MFLKLLSDWDLIKNICRHCIVVVRIRQILDYTDNKVQIVQISVNTAFNGEMEKAGENQGRLYSIVLEKR